MEAVRLTVKLAVMILIAALMTTSYEMFAALSCGLLGFVILHAKNHPQSWKHFYAVSMRFINKVLKLD